VIFDAVGGHPQHGHVMLADDGEAGQVSLLLNTSTAAAAREEHRPLALASRVQVHVA
jgi:hypothetical protein